MKNKSLLLLFISVFLLLVSCKQNNTEVDRVTVFEDGKTDYSIVVAEGASDEAKALGKELSDLSGADPAVLTDKSPEKPLEILIADTNRAATVNFVKKIQMVSTISAFHYIVAESDGKLVILSDTDIGYIYALDYIKTTYINNGVLSVPKGTYDLKQVIWDEYYSSKLYLDRLTAEADKNRFEEEKDQLENEKDRYENNTGNTIMTVEQAIEQYKNLAASFDTAAFGEYTSSTFKNANTYRTPTVYPTSAAHPRILFTKNTVEDVRKNLSADENSAAYKRYMALSFVPCDGIFKAVTGNMRHNYDADVVAKIEAKAFRYAMTGEKIYGYEAIYAAKNAMLTINVPHTVGDWCRTYGYLMYVVGCVYDWCYDLLTEADKAQIIAGGVNLLGMHLEIVCYVSDTNKVPIAQGTAYGHGAEDQLLVDYLSFAIACYDEAPEIYELVAGRILNDYVESQNFLYQSESDWEGSMYGPVRTVSTLMSNILFNKMTDGTAYPFTEKVEDAVVTSTHYIRPDGYVYRIGDINENNTAFQFEWIRNNCFYAGNLYGNSYLKSFAYEYLDEFTIFSNKVTGLSSVQFLAINDPEISHVYEGTAPLTRTTKYPNTNIFAKSGEDDNSFGIFMTMPENYSSSHAHAECGSFQIYYKGALASDSGAYSSWGDEHHMGYSMQTISSNSLLIYNPDLADYRHPVRPNMVYCGGQSIANGAVAPDTYDQLMQHPALGQCTSLGKANVEKDGVYLYSYLGGDMTKAYDAVTVGEDGEVTRYMFAVATDDKDNPLVFITFDRITADDASYKKTSLIHVQEEPVINGDFAIVTNGGGKMVVQSVGFDTDYTLIGGEGREFWVNDKNYPTNINIVDGSKEEYGWGRIEISPSVTEKTNHLLTVMYVTDADNNSSPIRAENIVSDTLAGAEILGKAVMFPKNEKLIDSEVSFTLAQGGECFVAGVSAGTWNIMNGDSVVATVEAADGTNLITFTTSAGTYTIVPMT